MNNYRKLRHTSQLFKPEKISTKLRVDFDGKAKSKNLLSSRQPVEQSQTIQLNISPQFKHTVNLKTVNFK